MKKTKKEILFKINELNVEKNEIDNLKKLVKEIKDYAIKESFAYTSEMDKKGISTTNPYLLKYRQGDLYYDKEYYTTYGKIIVSSFIEIIKHLNKEYQKADDFEKDNIKNLVKEYTKELLKHLNKEYQKADDFEKDNIKNLVKGYTKELLFDNPDIIYTTKDRYIEIKNDNDNLTYEISKETISQRLEKEGIDKRIVDFINTQIEDLKKDLENNIENNIKSRNNENLKKDLDNNNENNIKMGNNIDNIKKIRRLEKFTNK